MPHLCWGGQRTGFIRAFCQNNCESWSYGWQSLPAKGKKRYKVSHEKKWLSQFGQSWINKYKHQIVFTKSIILPWIAFHLCFLCGAGQNDLSTMMRTTGKQECCRTKTLSWKTQNVFEDSADNSFCVIFTNDIFHFTKSQVKERYFST